MRRNEERIGHSERNTAGGYIAGRRKTGRPKTMGKDMYAVGLNVEAINWATRRKKINSRRPHPRRYTHNDTECQKPRWDRNRNNVIYET